MDFIVQLLTMISGYDAIIVFVNRLTKRAHFHLMHTSVIAPEVAKAFFNIVFKNYSLPRVIVSDKDIKFMSRF